MNIKITGTGSALPKFRADNDFMAALVDTNDAWIQERTGIRERRLAKGEETTVSLAAEAGRQAIAQAGLRAEDVDLILVATLSPDHYFPSTACSVQAALKADRAAAFDLNAACAGFLFALHTAQAYLKAGFCKNALIIGSETMSKMLDWTDRSTCILFGDGAGAAVVESSSFGEEADEQKGGIVECIIGSDGSRGHVLSCKNRQVCNPLQSFEAGPDYMRMDGQAVFQFAVRQVPACITQLLEQTQIPKEEIRYYVLHQANSRILKSVARRLGEPEEKFPMNLDRYGNTSAASLPILLDELNRSGKLKAGDKLVLSGFGAGLTWGASLIEW